MWSGFRLRLALAVAAASIGLAPAAAGQGAAGPLAGTLAIDAGRCAGAVAGSYFRMILPTGTRDGPFLANGDSSCADQTYTPLVAGADGGLVLGAYQPEASPGFDGSGNSRSDRVTQPTPFFGVAFSTSTNAVDPQTSLAVPAPSLTVGDDGSLAGDLRAFAASWNNQEFNQGAPKPDGSRPGNTAAPSGAYDAATGRYTLEWASQIVGGPFDNFTGLWHLEGQVVPPAASSSGAGSGPAAATAGAGTAAPAGSEVGGTGTAGETPAAGDPTATTATGGATAAASAPAAATGSGVEGERIVSSGRAPAGWLVVLVAIVGVLAFAAFVVTDRALARTERPG